MLKDSNGLMALEAVDRMCTVMEAYKEFFAQGMASLETLDKELSVYRDMVSTVGRSSKKKKNHPSLTHHQKGRAEIAERVEHTEGLRAVKEKSDSIVLMN